MMFKCRYKKAFDLALFQMNEKFHNDVSDLLRFRDHCDFSSMRGKLTRLDAVKFDVLAYDECLPVDVLFAYCVERLQSYYLATRYGRSE